MAYDQLEPFGEGRLVLQLAMQMRSQVRGDMRIQDLVPYYLEPRIPIREPSENQNAEISARLATYFRRRFGMGQQDGH